MDIDEHAADDDLAVGDNETSDLMQDLEAAWDQIEAQNAEEANDGEAASDTAGAADQPAGEDTDTAAAAGSAGDPGAAAEPGSDAGGAEPGNQQPAASESGAPVGLPPDAREVWDKVPPEVQKAVAQRERDFAAGIQQYAENAKRAQAMDQVLQPFQQFLHMNGGPAPAIQQLLQTGAALQMGTPLQKAQTVANIISSFGVDITTLDGMLSNTLQGKPNGNGNANTEVASQIQEALAPFQNFMNSFQQQQQQAQQQEQQSIDADIAAFANDAKNEFYQDVKLDMADIMELAANRGRQMSMAEAYEQACRLHPTISKIVEQRAMAAASAEKLAAAANISGAPGGITGGESNPHSSRLDDINAAWDAHTS